MQGSTYQFVVENRGYIIQKGLPNASIIITFADYYCFQWMFYFENGNPKYKNNIYVYGNALLNFN